MCACCFPVPFHSFLPLASFPALPFATFFSVFPFAFPPLPAYPMPFLLPVPFTNLIDTALGRRHSNCTVFLAISHEKTRGDSVHMLFTYICYIYQFSLVAFKRPPLPSIPVVVRYCVSLFPSHFDVVSILFFPSSPLICCLLFFSCHDSPWYI